jgi:hypothetical protein
VATADAVNGVARALAALFDAPGGKILPVDPARKVRKMREG